MTYPSQPSNPGDPNWSAQPPATGYPEPIYQPVGDPAGTVGTPAPAYGYGYGYPVARPTNGMAIAALILSLIGFASCITAPVGAILGHVARRQIRERGDDGDGMALAAVIVGWIITGLGLLVLAFYAVIIVFAINNADTSTY